MTVQHAPVHEPFGDEVAIYMILRGWFNMQQISFESGRAPEKYPKILVVLDGPTLSW